MNDHGKKRLGLSTKIFLGLALGIACGIFFGETITFLGIIGEAFIQLLQMSVLPFVTFSLITGLGRLSYREALSLAKKCGALLLLLWAIALSMVALIPMAFPAWKSASFFSKTLVEAGENVDFLALYIPANPFHSLADAIVPAVVLFSIIVGVALIGIERKHVLLDPLSTVLDVLTRVTEFVIQLAPLGVFAISANAAATMQPEDLGRLQVYLLTYIAASLVLTLWILPGLVVNLTPLLYRDVLITIRGALLTAFATGNLMVVLPILTDQGRELLRKAELGSEEANSAVEVIVPTSFTFPSTGLLLSLSFVPFAAWYVGSSLSLTQYPSFLVSGVVTFFGGTIMAMPFLLNLLRLPADLFELFVTVDVFTSRFGTLLAAMHVWCLTLLGTCALSGQLRVQWVKFLGYVGISVMLSVGVLWGTRLFFTLALDPTYTKYTSLVEMDLKHEPVKSTVLESPPAPLSGEALRISRLDVIDQRGTLRVCFVKDALPFAFRNAEGKLVGFDIEMAHLLGKALNVSLEFVLTEKGTGAKVVEALNSGSCDIAMTGAPLRPRMTQRVAYSTPYMDTTIGFVVEDYRRDKFTSWKAIHNQGAITIGIPSQSQHYRSLAEKLLPQATFVPLDSPRDFFTNEKNDLDALIYIAEAGSAWTVVYPRYTVVVPLPHPVTIPFAYPMPHDERDLVDFVNAWLELQKKEKTIEGLFKYWIFGQGAENKEPRWSVIRNVLHWVED